MLEAPLRLFETLVHEALDGVCRARDHGFPVLMEVERRKHEVGDVSRVAAVRAPDAHAESQEAGVAE